jgi:hypothetical protein
VWSWSLGLCWAALFDLDAGVEDEGRAEIDLLEPEDETFAKLLAESERVAPSAPSDGED